MERSDIDPDRFIARHDDRDIRAAFEALDSTIRGAIPNRARTVWHGVFWGGTEQTIIGYGDITQPRPRGADVDWFLIGLARQKSYFSVYVNAVKDGAYLGHADADRLGQVKVGAANLTIRRLDHVDLEVLAELCAEADRLTP